MLRAVEEKPRPLWRSEMEDLAGVCKCTCKRGERGGQKASPATAAEAET